MYHIANSVLKNHHDSEDVLQDAFLSIAFHISQLEDPYSNMTKGYVCRVAENAALNYLERNIKRNQHCDIDDYESLPSTDDVIKNVELKDTASKMIDYILKMPPRYKSVLILNIIHRMAPKEISVVLGISIDKTRHMIKTGLKMLVKIAKENGYDY
jgi:RNA polymerase sigma-70 factor (ECF subfamily)